MPIQVDHSGQRQHVISLATQLVADEGMSALTFRRIAELAGTSTAIVSTYFTDKRDLMLSTQRAVADRTTSRFEAAVARGAGLPECLEAWLPLDAERRQEWKVIVAFWGVAASDPEMTAVQQEHLAHAAARIEKLLERRVKARHRGEQASRLLAAVFGIALHGLFQPSEGSRKWQRAALRAALDGPPGR